MIKRERDADAVGAGPGRPAKRRLPAGVPSSSAVAPLNLDLESLAGMLNTPLARQLGAEGEQGATEATDRACSSARMTAVSSSITGAVGRRVGVALCALS